MKPELRNQKRAKLPIPAGVDAETLSTLDWFYKTAQSGLTLDLKLVQAMDKVHAKLLPRLQAEKLRQEAESEELRKSRGQHQPMRPGERKRGS